MKRLTLLLVTAVMILALCRVLEQGLENTAAAWEPVQSRHAVQRETTPSMPEPLKTEAAENRAGEWVFRFSVTDFIESFNSGLAQDQRSMALGPVSQWKCFTYEEGIHSDHQTQVLEYINDPEIWSQPTVTVYVPTNGDYVQEVTVNFDDHAYSEALYRNFETLCFYTLKVFFPDMEDAQIVSLYREVNDLCGGQVLEHEQGYQNGSVPQALFHKDGIGVYAYAALGEWQHMCVIPITGKLLAEYEEKGTAIYEIS